MSYIVQAAPDGLSVDTSAAISPELAMQISRTRLMGQPVLGVCQYVGFEHNGGGDITTERLEGIMSAGLGLWLVQHVLYPGWTASAALGAQFGAAARRNAESVGYLPGAHLALDLEGCKSVGQPVIDYVNAWADAVRDKYPVLLYVGYACGLTAQQLYDALPNVHCYWSDFGPRQVTTRGFAIKQHAQTSFCGIPVDPDEHHADLLGDRLHWMQSDSAADAPTQPELKFD